MNSGTLAFSPENKLTRTVASYALEVIAEDNFGFLASLAVPSPKGYKNSTVMEAALTRPNAMDDVLCGIQFDDNMASKRLVLYIMLELVSPLDV